MKLIAEFEKFGAKIQLHQMDPKNVENLISLKEGKDIPTDDLINHHLWKNVESTFNESDKLSFITQRRISRNESEGT